MSIEIPKKIDREISKYTKRHLWGLISEIADYVSSRSINYNRFCGSDCTLAFDEWITNLTDLEIVYFIEDLLKGLKS